MVYGRTGTLTDGKATFRTNDGGMSGLGKTMRVFYGGVIACCLLLSCGNVDSDLDAKWQLRESLTADGVSERNDSVFYNFQKGSFSMICLTGKGAYETFFGNYTLKDDKISIILLPESQENEYYRKRINWEDGRRIFNVEKLSSSSLHLEYRGVRYLFRKYG